MSKFSRTRRLIFGRFDMPDRETFFTNAERSLIAKLMLDKTSYTTIEKSGKQHVHIGKYHRGQRRK